MVFGGRSEARDFFFDFEKSAGGGSFREKNNSRPLVFSLLSLLFFLETVCKISKLDFLSHRLCFSTSSLATK